MPRISNVSPGLILLKRLVTWRSEKGVTPFLKSNLNILFTRFLHRNCDAIPTTIHFDVLPVWALSCDSLGNLVEFDLFTC